jgi:hypothetical protein
VQRSALFAAGLPAALVVGSFVGACAPPAMAQNVLLDVKPPAPGDAVYGIAIGDWDGDGIGDLAVGAPTDSTVAYLAGAARVHSGKDGSVLAQFFGVNVFDSFGWSLARMPDLDGDGIDDLAVAASYADYNGPDTGSVFLYSGGTGALQRRIDGPSNGMDFGHTLGAIGDVDGDGVPDLYISGGYVDVVHVHSGADGHEITSFKGPGGEYFGFAVSVLDDLDADGVRDLLVGAPQHRNSQGLTVGEYFVLSTGQGTTLGSQEGTFNGEELGFGTASLADLDGDGVRDYAVSATLDPHGFAAMVLVFSGATGAQLAKIVSPSNDQPLLPWISDAGDLNGDGFGDLAISGSWTDNSTSYGAVFLVSGKTFLCLDRILTFTDGTLPFELAPFGDYDGDGFDDLIVGPWLPPFGGEVRIYSGNDLWIDANPWRPLAGDTLDLVTREGVAGAATVLVLEEVDGTATFQLVNGVDAFDASGGSTVSATVPSGLAGHDMRFRSYTHDASGRLISSAKQSVQFQ